MRESRVRLVWLAIAAASLARPLPAEEPRLGVIGQWWLSGKESEDPELKFTVAPADQASPGPFGGQQADPWGGRSSGSPRPSPPPAPEAARASLRNAVPAEFHEFLDTPKSFTIAAEGDRLTYDRGSGAVLELVAGGAPAKDGVLSRTARWEGQILVVETWNDKGVRLITRFNLMPGERKLEVYSRLSDSRGRALTLRRVFAASEEEATAAPEKPRRKKS